MRKKMLKGLMATVVSFSVFTSQFIGVEGNGIFNVVKAAVSDTTKLQNAYFRVLQRGETRPTGTDFTNVDFQSIDYGKVTELKTIVNDSEKLEDIVVEIPKQTEVLLGLQENEKIEWFTMVRQGCPYMVYGEIVEKEETVSNAEEVVEKTNTQPQKAYYRVLKRGEVRPTGTDFTSVDFQSIDYGTVTELKTVVNNPKELEKMVVEVPKQTELLMGLQANEEIEWFTMVRQGCPYMVYGEIVEKKATPIETEEVAEDTNIQPQKAYYRVLKRGEVRPTGTDFSNVDFQSIDYGMVTELKTVVNDPDELEKMVVEVPKQTSVIMGLQANEEIEWFTMVRQGCPYMVYGEIVQNNFVGVTKSRNVGSTMATIVPTIVPTVAATVAPSVSSEPVYCYFEILKEGQERPTSFKEYDSKEYYWGNYGYVSQKKTVENCEAEVAPLVISEGYQTYLYVKDDERIAWYGARAVGCSWRIYGEIINVNMEASTAEYDDSEYLVFDTVKDMLNYNYKLKFGTILETKGYYSVGDGGAAKYEVAVRGTGAKFSSLVMPTGQHINMIIENDFINMKTLGAGNCVSVNNGNTNRVDNDDSKRFNEAVSLMANNNGGTIYFPQGEYRCASKVNVGGSNITIKGAGKDKTVIYTDNGYDGDEHFITVAAADHILIEDLKVEARETVKVGYYRQCSVMFASYVTIQNCLFNVQNNVIKDNNTDKQYTNITFYTGWHHVKVDNCQLYQMGAVERGACVGVIDMWSNGCEDAVITNCEMHQNAHDELMGIFALRKATAAIDGVYVANNKMYTSSACGVSNKTMAMTVAYDDSNNVKNVVIENNYFKAEVPSNFMTFGTIDNCLVQNNTFEIVHTMTTSGTVMDAKKGVTIKNNKIKVTTQNGSGVQSLFKGAATFENNDVDVDCYCYFGAYCGSKLKNNKMVFRGAMHGIAADPELVLENDITVYGKLDNMFHISGLAFDCVMKENTINYLYYEKDEETNYPLAFNGAVIYAGFHAGIQGYTVNFSNNTVNAPNCSAINKHVLSHGTGDSTPQNIIIENNKLEKYIYVRSIYGKTENITFNNNKTVAGDEIDYEKVSVRFLDKVG